MVFWNMFTKNVAHRTEKIRLSAFGELSRTAVFQKHITVFYDSEVVRRFVADIIVKIK